MIEQILEFLSHFGVAIVALGALVFVLRRSADTTNIERMNREMEELLARVRAGNKELEVLRDRVAAWRRKQEERAQHATLELAFDDAIETAVTPQEVPAPIEWPPVHQGESEIACAWRDVEPGFSAECVCTLTPAQTWTPSLKGDHNQFSSGEFEVDVPTLVPSGGDE